MPNAWFNYFFPLLISAVFVAGGLSFFRRYMRGDRDGRGNTAGPAAAAGLVCACVGGAIGLAVILLSPTPWKRQAIFNHILHTPPERILRFVIKAGHADQYRPLARSEVVIDDPERIGKIARILDTAREIDPDHPRANWTAEVEMVTRDGIYHFEVHATSGGHNGTLVGFSTAPGGLGWNLGDVRADGLEKILEDAVDLAGAR